MSEDRIAYEDLQPGDIIQEGDEWRHESGRWKPFTSLDGSCVQVRHTQKARRPYRVSTIQEIGDALASAQKAATQLQDERDELRAEMDTVKGDRMNLREALTAEQRAHKVTMTSGLQACKERDELKTALRESHAAHEFTMKQGLAACKERDEACKERDLARSEVARLSTELWARKPLEDRVASLTEELAQAREGIQDLLKTIADNADQFAEHTASLVQQRDGFDAEVQRLQEVVRNLYSEPTARQVQDMLRAWATELDWSAGCFDSVAREQIDTIQKTLVAVIERIETVVNPEGGRDGE